MIYFFRVLLQSLLNRTILFNYSYNMGLLPCNWIVVLFKLWMTSYIFSSGKARNIITSVCWWSWEVKSLNLYKAMLNLPYLINSEKNRLWKEPYCSSDKGNTFSNKTCFYVNLWYGRWIVTFISSLFCRWTLISSPFCSRFNHSDNS